MPRQAKMPFRAAVSNVKIVTHFVRVLKIVFAILML